MTREQFRERVLKEIEYAQSECYPQNVLDLRVSRHPYRVNEDNEVFSISEIDDAYDFIKDAEEWYVDVYENFVGENYAEFTDFAVASWE